MLGRRKFRRNEQRLCFAVMASGFNVILDERHCFSKHTETVIKYILGHTVAFISVIKVPSRRLPQTLKSSRPCARDGGTAVRCDGDDLRVNACLLQKKKGHEISKRGGTALESLNAPQNVLCCPLF